MGWLDSARLVAVGGDHDPARSSGRTRADRCAYRRFPFSTSAGAERRTPSTPAGIGSTVGTGPTTATSRPFGTPNHTGPVGTPPTPPSIVRTSISSSSPWPNPPASTSPLPASRQRPTPRVAHTTTPAPSLLVPAPDHTSTGRLPRQVGRHRRSASVHRRSRSPICRAAARPAQSDGQ
jgi:hypothetical protein